MFSESLQTKAMIIYYLDWVPKLATVCWYITSDNIDYHSCMPASTMYEVGVIISYECRVADSRQLHLCSKCVQGVIDCNLLQFIIPWCVLSGSESHQAIQAMLSSIKL